jgi:uncharacterized protein YbjQ (UPF0145 family)
VTRTPATPGASGDLPGAVRQALAVSEPARGSRAGLTSDLTIDETLILHSVAWAPRDLVVGLSVQSVPSAIWSWGSGEIELASRAHARAFAHAVARLHAEAVAVGAHGVVGVHVERRILSSHIEVELVGTAVGPTDASAVPDAQVFVSDLSARDFALLLVGGWRPVALAVGASFTYAPRRAVGAALRQQTQNVELTNYTAALYDARATAMERMQRAALDSHGAGIVDVTVTEGPLHFAAHAIGFTAWGTVVVPTSSGRTIDPLTVVSLNDAVNAFDVAPLT